MSLIIITAFDFMLVLTVFAGRLYRLELDEISVGFHLSREILLSMMGVGQFISLDAG